ncbi:MAG: nucleoside deaminase [Chlorobiaceae bacterium]
MKTCNSARLLPQWIKKFSAAIGKTILSDHDRRKFVIELARNNTLHGTGGPFGAAVFERESGRLVSVGVNLVIQSRCSHAHAEMVAIAAAQHRIASYTLNNPDYPEHELVTSCEPCTMCFGAIIWSGLTRIVCGASTSDAITAGFDEGPKPENWTEELAKRGIKVVTGICRNEAAAVLQFYIDNGGIIYNTSTRARSDSGK